MLSMLLIVREALPIVSKADSCAGKSVAKGVTRRKIGKKVELDPHAVSRVDVILIGLALFVASDQIMPSLTIIFVRFCS